jgi:membrane protein YdbS with pleckstrin-like domain
MSGMEITLAVVLGLIVNEFSDVSPWLARRLVAWSARQRYGDTARAEIRAEELGAVINDRPGKLFKLGTGVRFASAALAVRLRRLVAREPQPGDEPLPEDVLPFPRVLPEEDEPSRLVARYLFPTERYRGEWKRHWIHLFKGLVVITLYAVFGVWATILRIKPQYVDWIVAGIIVGAVLLAGFRAVGWYVGRFIITNKRLMSTEGVLVRRVAMIPLLRVTDLRYVQTPIGRLFSYGTFQLESASRSNAMRRIVHLPNPNELYLRLVEEMYEPEAVESRLAYSRDDERELPELDFDADEPEVLPARRRLDEPAPPAPAVVQREIIYQIGALSNQLATLSAAIQRLSPTPDESTDHIAADSPDDVESGPHRRVVPRPLPRRRPTNFSAPVPEATD